ncbi:MAG: M20 aminoacylase family protein [Devosia sp.]
MPVINRIAEFHDDVVAWRRDFHGHPELLYDLPRTSARVAELLQGFGVDEVTTGVGRSGVVGLIRGSKPGTRTIGLRADMDALPILERTGKPHASLTPGKMHACGHDGHTAMLLGAARYLAETRNFEGSVALIFQPAEEGGAGARTMIEDGLLERFGIDEVYGMHNMPGLAPGSFAIREGAIMASSDKFTITIEGVGGHAARPHLSTDPVIIAASMITALQTIVSRNRDPLLPAVLSITSIHAGQTFNVTPREVTLLGTIRALDEGVRSFMQERLCEMVPLLAAGFGGTATVDYEVGYPVVVNHRAGTELAARVAREVAGERAVDAETPPSMGGEDFAFMLNQRPGAFIFLGNGNTGELHTDTYDFNDEIIPVGSSFWVRLVETALPTR